MAKKNWIAGAISKEGSLRKALHTKKGAKIGRAALKRAAAGSGITAKRARLALTLSKFHKKGK